MGTDIAERLREWQYYDPKAFGREILKNVAEAADEIEQLRNTVVAADREIKASHADADRYRDEIVRLQAALERAEDRVEKWHNKVCKQETEIARLVTALKETTVEADNAAALKASDVRTTGGDASLSSTPTAEMTYKKEIEKLRADNKALNRELDLLEEKSRYD